MTYVIYSMSNTKSKSANVIQHHLTVTEIRNIP